MNKALEKICPNNALWFPKGTDQIGTIPILCQQKDWVGGSRKGPVLLTFITHCIYAGYVGGVQKGQKYADVL